MPSYKSARPPPDRDTRLYPVPGQLCPPSFSVWRGQPDRQELSTLQTVGPHAPSSAERGLYHRHLRLRHKDPHRNAIGFTLRDYLQLVDWAGRAVRDGKRGAISEDAPPILQRMGLEPGRFLEHLQGHGATEEHTAMGHLQRIRQAAEALGRRFLKGGGDARRLYVAGVIE
jgi:hypothetical protein